MLCKRGAVAHRTIREFPCPRCPEPPPSSLEGSLVSEAVQQDPCLTTFTVPDCAAPFAKVDVRCMLVKHGGFLSQEVGLGRTSQPASTAKSSVRRVSVTKNVIGPKTLSFICCKSSLSITLSGRKICSSFSNSVRSIASPAQ